MNKYLLISTLQIMYFLQKLMFEFGVTLIHLSMSLIQESDLPFYCPSQVALRVMSRKMNEL